ncbi:MAG: carboxymuconolactone decarboxylase family protein [Halieaceae bacterium]|jgi:alkylhydroperoxidase family enzyme
MSRISFVPTADWSDELRNYVAADSATDLELGITRMLAHAPELAMGVLSFGGTMATKRTLPERLIELLRLRVAFHNQCRSCMAIRYRAASADITEAEVCSLEKPAEAESLDDREQLAVELGDRFACDHLSIDAAFFEQLKALFSEAEIMELLMHCALYVGVGRLAAVLDMTEDLPDGFNLPFGQDHHVTPTAGEPVVVR